MPLLKASTPNPGLYPKLIDEIKVNRQPEGFPSLLFDILRVVPGTLWEELGSMGRLNKELLENASF